MPNGLAGPFRLTLYSLLAFATAQQQLPRQDGIRSSPPENAALRQLTQTSKDNTNNNNNAPDLQHTPTYGKGKSTDHAKHHHISSSSKDERAVATVAPTGHRDPAVRAPSARSAAGTASAGLQTVRARRLQDWEVEDFVLLATVDGSIHARGRNSGKELWKFHSDRPMVEISYTQNRFKEYDGAGNEEDIMWIVEPNNGGTIYIFVPGEGGGIQKWDMTVKKLADDFSPYEDPNMPFVYTAEKRNTLYTLNATDGAALKYFSSGGGGIMGQKSCRKVNNLMLDDDDDECEPTATVNLGRTEYTVNIQSRISQENVCTIKYFEWTPNKRDDDLVGQYMNNMDNKYIYTRHDGSIIALELDQEGDSAPNPLYQKQFTSSPVVRVFDVVKPQGADTRETPLVILPQPVAPLVNGGLHDNVFINCTEAGSFYALSEMSYPSVTDGATKAKCYKKSGLLDDLAFSEEERKRRQSLTPGSLVGVHALNEILQRDPNLLTISGPSEKALPIPMDLEREPYRIPKETMDRITIDGPPRSTIEALFQLASTQNLFNTLFVLALCWIFWLMRKSSAPEKQVLPIEPVSQAPPLIDEGVPPLDPVAGERKVRFAPEVIDEGAETGTESLAPTQKVDEVVQGPVTEDGTLPLPPKRKKAHRGSRGGQKNRPSNLKNKKKKDDDDEVEKIVEGVIKPKQPMQPDAGPSENSVTDVDDSMTIKSIKVDTDRVLGYGSGGTTVYEGTFEGREVAVKRMLLQYYDLASQEIKLLSQSDDHANVVRYYRHEKDKDFLYIAVERCQTSLWDLFREGQPLDSLVDTQMQLFNDINANMTSTLYQIAAGLRHLHSLRIIHRDIKPQNILVAFPKKNQTTGPRLVISDFGLCRMLQDNASTLVGTVGNAGTIGWKAPEVIGQPRNGPGTQSSTQNDSNSNSSANGELGTTPGVKRAVDIFSLGCVFFYVLTNGAHPFDSEDSDIGHVEREINIKKWDRPRLNKLSQWGDSTEEPRQLIEWMLAKQPENRPTAAQVMNHPFFWSDAKRLNFLCDVSDHWERECRDPPSYDLQILERIGYERNVHKGDFLTELDRCFVDTLGKQRKYTGDRMLDLLRALRNKKNHYADMDEFVKRKVGDLPSGYLNYWMRKFPNLLMACYDAVRECGLEGDARFRSYLEEAV
jgi:serine/threonine-protein kinase/endoribonuclease IRE1